MDYTTADFVLREYEGVTVVRFTNKNLTAAQDLDRINQEVQNLIDNKAVRKLILDFKHVEYISSAALGALITINKKLADKKGLLVLSHPENIVELLRISHTEKLFKTAPDPREAVKMYFPA